MVIWRTTGISDASLDKNIGILDIYAYKQFKALLRLQ
jgi:hypothetical protein